MTKVKECISGEPVFCPHLNKGKKDILQAYVKTFRDGTTEVMCTKKNGDGQNSCQITKDKCTFETAINEGSDTTEDSSEFDELMRALGIDFEQGFTVCRREFLKYFEEGYLHSPR